MASKTAQHIQAMEKAERAFSYMRCDTDPLSASTAAVRTTPLDRRCCPPACTAVLWPCTPLRAHPVPPCAHHCSFGMHALHPGSRDTVALQLKRLVAQEGFTAEAPGACSCARLGWKDLVAVLKEGLRDLQSADRRGDADLSADATCTVAREATTILERAASLAPYRLAVRCRLRAAQC